jgi:small subunit ribosomal protein S2
LTVSIKQLLEAGVHFGHQTRRWNPKMARYIFGERNGIYIVNLEKTEQELKTACEFLRSVAARGEYVLFVGTKKQAQQTIVEESTRCEMFYVDQRWLGDTLTNFDTIRKSIKRLEELERMSTDGTFDKLKKREVSVLNKEMAKLLKNLGGIRKMNKLPGALFIVDAKKEETAVKEARRLSIPVVALADTNSNPDILDYVIPGNDDAIKSIRLVSSTVADAVIEGRSKYEQTKAAQIEKAEKDAAQKKAEKKILEDTEEIEEKLVKEAKHVGKRIAKPTDDLKKRAPKTKRKVE